MRLTRRQVLAAAGATLLARPALAAGREGFDLVEREIAVDGLDPAHDGLRVAHLTDIHVGDATPDGRIIAAVRAVNRARPDLVLLTGDYVTVSKRPVRRVGRLLSGFEAPVWAVLGNHDHWVDPQGVREELEREGCAVLRNQATVARFRGADLWVLGIDDGRTRNDDVAATFAGVPATGTRLVMAHTPPTADKLPVNAGLVCFSGHTHGGQFFLPGLTEWVAERAGQPYLRGLYRVRGNALHVNVGLGYGGRGPFPRVGTTPEVAVVTLRRAG